MIKSPFFPDIKGQEANRLTHCKKQAHVTGFPVLQICHGLTLRHYRTHWLGIIGLSCHHFRSCKSDAINDAVPEPTDGQRYFPLLR